MSQLGKWSQNLSKSVVCNPCQSSPSLTILVSLWIITLLVLILVNIQVSLTQNTVTEVFYSCGDGESDRPRQTKGNSSL